MSFYLYKNGGLEGNMKHRIKCGWTKWRKVSGILYGKRIYFRLKGKLFKSSKINNVMYGTEC